MQEVPIPIRLLKKWAQQSYKDDVQSRATIAAFHIGQRTNPEAAQMYAEIIEREKPEAETMVKMRYKKLIDAIDSGEGIREALEEHLR